VSGRGLCDELITRPEESHRLRCEVVCGLETTKIFVNEEEGQGPLKGFRAKKKKNVGGKRKKEREREKESR
jgi:hypothetical protein